MSFSSSQATMLLRVAPLVTSSFCIWFASDQHYFLHLFTRPEIRSKAPTILPPYLRRFYRDASARVFITWVATLSTSIANVTAHRQALEANQSLSWYTAGLALTAGHALFAPIIVPTIWAILKLEDGPTGQKDSMGLLRKWLRIHVVRSLTVDLAAWVCFVVAVTRQV
jgi:hypothetical protein